MHSINTFYKISIVYFTLIVAKFKFYPSIINSYFKNDFFSIFNINFNLKIILFAIICGLAHSVISSVVREILVKKIYIHLVDLLLICTIFYVFKLFNYSRLLLFTIVICLTILNYSLDVQNKTLLVIYTIILLISIYIFQFEEINSIDNTDNTATLQPVPNQNEYLESLDLEKCLNTFSSNNYKKIQSDSSKKDIYIIGHAYGSHSGENLALSNSVLSFFETLTKENKVLILTGDIVRDSSIENLELAKNQITSNFSEYYIAVGNHDIDAGKSNSYYRVFDSDLNFINLNSLEMIVANFSTYNWKPALADQVSINEFIKQSTKETIVIFSHQVFWYNLTVNEPKLNGKITLKEELGLDTLDWLETNGKNVIIVSGDYGIGTSKTFCEYNQKKNILFIASGIYDRPEDSGLIIEDTRDGFIISEFKLSDS